MKWMGHGAWIASIAGLCAQTETMTPDTNSQPPIRMQDVSEQLGKGNSDLADLAQRLLGTENANRLFYFPTHDEPATPKTWGFKYEDETFRSSDGTKLHGWFLPSRSDEAKATIVFSHGNAGAIGHHLGFVMWMVQAGYNVFMYDYRGFGKSEGSVDRRGMVEDVKAAFKYVASRDDVDTGKLISYGHSLGGAKSVTALAETPSLKLAAMIVDGTFTSYQAMARVVGGQIGADLITDEFSPKDYIGKIHGIPLLAIHGEEDQVVPFAQGAKLFELANEPKTFFRVAHGRHGDSLSRDNGAFRKQMLEWLDGVL